MELNRENDYLFRRLQQIGYLFYVFLIVWTEISNCEFYLMKIVEVLFTGYTIKSDVNSVKSTLLNQQIWKILFSSYLD